LRERETGREGKRERVPLYLLVEGVYSSPLAYAFDAKNVVAAVQQAEKTSFRNHLQVA
jgi:hypothetical protein